MEKWLGVFLWCFIVGGCFQPLVVSAGNDFKDPYSCFIDLRTEDEIRAQLEDLLNRPNEKDAVEFCQIAEILKRNGDFQAETYYERAIAAAPTEPAYEIFYADYLRNFRGADNPLFPEAEKHFWRAQSKFDALPENSEAHIKSKLKNLNETKKRLRRGLDILYERDGLPLYSKSIADDVSQPFVFFSSQNRYGKSPSEIDEIDDTRGYTSQALFSESAIRLNRPLSKNELKNIIRDKEQFDTFNRIRFRYKSLPVLDIFAAYRNINNAQVTQFFSPNEFNDVRLKQYGLSIQKPLNLAPYFDLFLRGTYSHIERKGVIEFLPNTEEKIDQYEGNVAVSRFFGPDKATLSFTYVYQDIDPNVNNFPERNREIFAGRFSYRLFITDLLGDTFGTRFQNRGLELFAGTVIDKDRFGTVVAKKEDYFVGATLSGFTIPWLPHWLGNPFDLTVQPTIFRGSVDSDQTQDNSQYRTNINLLYRIFDQEKNWKQWFLGEIAFLHVIIPFSHDIALEGPEDFENFKIGVQLSGKFFGDSTPSTAVFASVRYDFQRFYELDKNDHAVFASLSFGF